VRMVDIIKKKRDGGKLSHEEISFVVESYTQGNIPDYQVAAFLMAVYFQGMDPEEMAYLTREMMESGEVLDLSYIKAPKIDKHSTGGVGDKISLPLAPLVASCGIVVPMISGRALGHTGGTLDKLESIPGYRTNLSVEEFKKQLENIGVSIIGQTEKLCPADRKMYALRDVTATVESIPLISASIMSKKLAEGIDGLVLDVKTGSGAFMRKYEDAKKLAVAMVSIGKEMGKEVKALITNMDEPLGFKIGNALEVVESVEVLRGEGPEDVRELTISLGSQMLIIGEKAKNEEEARSMLLEALASGKAYDKWVEMVSSQGGDPDSILRDDFTYTEYTCFIKAEKDGYLYGYDTYKVGVGVSMLGAGREKIEDKIDHKVGIILHKKVGDRVRKGEIIMEIHYTDKEKLERAIPVLESSFTLSESKPEKKPLIFEIIE